MSALRLAPPIFFLSVLLSVLVLPAAAGAQLEAHFTASNLDYNGALADCDTVVFGLPVCELYVMMGVFTGPTLRGSLYYYPPGCGYEEVDDGGWLLGQTIVRPLPDGTSQASVLFALFDDDPDTLDQDDLLGTHLSTHGSPFDSFISSNNNLRPAGLAIKECEGGLIDDDARTDRFGLDYQVWFTDASPPSTPSQPTHQDGTASSGWDDDTTLDFSWPAASDPNSGVWGYGWSLRRDGVIISSGTTPGLTLSHTGVDGSSYELAVRARNGSSGTVQLDNPTWSEWSAWSGAVTVDLVAPSTSITDPPAGSWHSASFAVTFTDSDENLDATGCEYDPNSSSWSSRTCNTTAQVGVPSDCSVEGPNTCTVFGRSRDQAGNGSSAAFRQFSIDYTAETIDSFTVLEAAGGNEILEGVWTQDRDPYFSWTSSASVSPLAGFSYATDTDPDCTAEGSDASVPLPPGSLADGAHEFRVRAIDQAGNCGSVASRALDVDGTPDPIDSLQAFNEPGGGPITDGAPQLDLDPHLEWDPPVSAAPITGYSTAVDIAADCDVDTTDTFFDLGPLAHNSSTLFAVRAIDEANNCGPEATFEIVVDDVPLFADGFESSDTTSWSSTRPAPQP